MKNTVFEFGRYKRNTLYSFSGFWSVESNTGTTADVCSHCLRLVCPFSLSQKLAILESWPQILLTEKLGNTGDKHCVIVCQNVT